MISDEDVKIFGYFFLVCISLGVIIGGIFSVWAIWYVRRPLPRADHDDPEGSNSP
jgi:hypothetical protein